MWFVLFASFAHWSSPAGLLLIGLVCLVLFGASIVASVVLGIPFFQQG